jgi:hypothetical protein
MLARGHSIGAELGKGQLNATVPNCCLKPTACGTLTHGEHRRRSHAAA